MPEYLPSRWWRIRKFLLNPQVNGFRPNNNTVVIDNEFSENIQLRKEKEITSSEGGVFERSPKTETTNSS